MLHMHSSIWIRTGRCGKTTSPDASHSEYQRGLSRRGARRKHQATSLKQRGNEAKLFARWNETFQRGRRVFQNSLLL